MNAKGCSNLPPAVSTAVVKNRRSFENKIGRVSSDWENLKKKNGK